MDNSTLSPLPPPSHLIADYLQICYLGMTCVFGSAINLVALRQLLKSYLALAHSQQSDLKTAFVFLKLNLNVSNLCILLIYNPVSFSWLITYAWTGGDVMCRICQTCSAFAFYISSFIITSIAVDRLRNVTTLLQLNSAKVTTTVTIGLSPLRSVQCLVGSAWVLAVLCSVPQALVWRTVEVAPDWDQCVTFWQARRDPDSRFFATEKVYALWHLLTVFWVPLGVIVLCYVIIAVKLLRLSLSSFSSVPDAPRPTPDSPWAAPPPPLPLKTDVCRVAEVRTLVPKATLGGARIPQWRSQMRDKMFRTTALILSSYVLLWLPYNVLSLVMMVRPDLTNLLSSHLDWLKSLIVINAVLNPFLYEFGKA